MNRTLNRHFAVALKEIRAAATVACCLVAFSLVAQVISWSLLAFTDMRFERAEQTVQSDPTVVTANDLRAAELHNAVDREEDAPPAADVNRQLSRWDHILGLTTSLAGAGGTLGCFALIPLIGLGVILAAGSATDGVDKASGAFVWSVVLVTLTLPWGLMFEAVPYKGMFATYATMVTAVDAFRGVPGAIESAGSESAILFYGRFGLLPIAGLAGVSAIAIRFRAGIEAGLMPKEDHRLDPELEKEVAAIKPTSLLAGGRAEGALSSIQPDKPKQVPLSVQPPLATKTKTRTNTRTNTKTKKKPSTGTPLGRPI